MSLAWGSLVLLIVLLPGILFFVGIYLPEQFTREAEPRSPLGQLAGALLIAFLIHGSAYIISFHLPCVPQISVAALLETISVDPGDRAAVDAVSEMFSSYRGWIFGYFFAASGTGIALGASYGHLSSRRSIPGLSRHPWVYDLRVDGLTYVHVLTHVRQNDRVLMYKGFLRAFGLQQDGRFTYLVLSDVVRAYLRLAESGSVTNNIKQQKTIGASAPGGVALPGSPATIRARNKSLFVIEGEDVANAVFDVLETTASAAKPDELREIIRKEAEQIGMLLSDLEIDQIVKYQR